MSNLVRQGDANLAAFGQFGYGVVDTGANSAANKVIVAVQSLSDDTTVTTTSDDTDVWPNLSALVLPTGTTIFGRWTQVTIGGTAGKAVVYYAQ